MKKIWKETLQEIILTIITLGINLLVKGKKKHTKDLEELQKEDSDLQQFLLFDGIFAS